MRVILIEELASGTKALVMTMVRIMLLVLQFWNIGESLHNAVSVSLDYRSNKLSAAISQESTISSSCPTNPLHLLHIQSDHDSQFSAKDFVCTVSGARYVPQRWWAVILRPFQGPSLKAYTECFRNPTIVMSPEQDLDRYI